MNKRSDAELATLDKIIRQFDETDETQKKQKEDISILRDLSCELDQEIEELTERIRLERSRL